MQDTSKRSALTSIAASGGLTLARRGRPPDRSARDSFRGAHSLIDLAPP